MINADFIKDLSSNIIHLFNSSPTSDENKNIHALIQGAFTKMELISREEYDIQTEILKKTRTKLEALEKKLADLENLLQKQQ